MGDSRWSGLRPDDGVCSGVAASENEDCLTEQDQLLPIANVGRIMKKILPPNAKISKDAKEIMQESVSEFIGFVTGEASSKCLKDKRKTLTGDDICSALGSLGLDDLADATRMYLEKYRVSEAERAEAAMGNSAISRDQELDLFGVYPVRDNQVRTSSSYRFDLTEDWNRNDATANPH